MNLLSPIQLGSYRLPNRIAMAPMTRNRCAPGNVPTALNALYYAQRASAGLLITEGTPVSAFGAFPMPTPGIYTEEQAAGWALTTEAVHRAGGHIFMQLWHCGRASHPTALPDGVAPVAPSAVKMEHPVRPGRPPHAMPRALSLDEIPGVIDEFVRGAHYAKAAGFDGVELHGANGYFLDQFLRDKTNRRTDKYGGSIENRARLGLEVTAAVAEIWGADKVGYRLSPSSAHNDIADSDPHATFTHMVKALDRFGLAYLHLVEPQPEFPVVPGDPLVAAYFRPHWRGTLIANSGYTRQRADAAIASGAADMVSFGNPYIANPDLAERLRLGVAPVEPDRATVFINEPRGLIDYPTLAAAE